VTSASLVDDRQFPENESLPRNALELSTWKPQYRTLPEKPKCCLRWASYMSDCGRACSDTSLFSSHRFDVGRHMPLERALPSGFSWKKPDLARAAQIIEDEVCYKWSEYQCVNDVFAMRARMFRDVYLHKLVPSQAEQGLLCDACVCRALSSCRLFTITLYSHRPFPYVGHIGSACTVDAG
jgi:hypothetical protein